MSSGFRPSSLTEADLSKMGPLGDWKRSASQSDLIEGMHPRPQYVPMSGHDDLTRHEIQARLEAADARVSGAVESIRADAATLRAELREGIAEIKAQGERSQAAADRFYAEAGRALAEIRLAAEQKRSTIMEMGYRAAAWIFGAMVALGGLYFTIRAAVSAPTTPVATEQVQQAKQPPPTVRPR